jgi:hypothetical protein
MRDADGTLIKLGHHLAIGSGLEGVVVFSIDSDEFAPDFAKAEWAYLGRGVMVRTDRAGLVWLPDADADIRVIG